MTREEFEIRRHTPTTHRKDNESFLEYLNQTWDVYGNVIEPNSFKRFFRKFEPQIKKDDVAEYVTIEYNPQTRKKEKIYLQGIWDGEKVQFDYQQMIVRAKPWLRLVSREYKINIFGFKFVIKRIF